MNSFKILFIITPVFFIFLLFTGCTSALKDDTINSLSEGKIIHIAGYSIDSTGQVHPEYWRNGKRTDLSVSETYKYSEANSFYVYDGDVYICGFLYDAFNLLTPVYWKNGVKTVLSKIDNTMNAHALSIFANENGVYIAGYSYIMLGGFPIAQPIFWHNGVRTNLGKLASTDDAFANSITVSGSDVYIAGNSGNAPVYWKNSGTPITLTRINNTKKRCCFIHRSHEKYFYFRIYN